jgi:hypothetical protein
MGLSPLNSDLFQMMIIAYRRVFHKETQHIAFYYKHIN